MHEGRLTESQAEVNGVDRYVRHPNGAETYRKDNLNTFLQ